MAVNTDQGLGGLEDLVIDLSVMSSDAADPFSTGGLHHYPQPQTRSPDSSSRSAHGQSHQQQMYPEAQMSGVSGETHTTQPPYAGLGSSASDSLYSMPQQAASAGMASSAVQLHPALGQPIFFQGQWFTPAPPGFTPPAPAQQHSLQQQQYGGLQHHQHPAQQQAGMLQQQQQPQHAYQQQQGRTSQGVGTLLCLPQARQAKPWALHSQQQGQLWQALVLHQQSLYSRSRPGRPPVHTALLAQPSVTALRISLRLLSLTGCGVGQRRTSLV